MTDLTRPSPEMIARADQSLVRTVDGLADADYAGGSLLPDWTRGHVIAHLALNAEGLAGVLHGAHVGQPQAMYASPARRDADIAELAAAGPAALRERFMASTTQFADALGAMHDDDWPGRFERTPGGPEFALPNVALMRVRELEIHHADLDAGYSPADWPEDFRMLLLESMTKRAYPAPFSVRPTDLDRTWHYGVRDGNGDGDGDGDGGGGPVVSGTSYALGWWLTGRGAGEQLTTDAGTLPEVESW